MSQEVQKLVNRIIIYKTEMSILFKAKVQREGQRDGGKSLRFKLTFKQ